MLQLLNFDNICAWWSCPIDVTGFTMSSSILLSGELNRDVNETFRSETETFNIASETRPRRSIFCSRRDLPNIFRDETETINNNTVLIKVKVNFEIYIADRKATTLYRQSFFCSAVLTPQHYHWYAATRFAFPGGSELQQSTNRIVQWALRQWYQLAEGWCTMMRK